MMANSIVPLPHFVRRGTKSKLTAIKHFTECSVCTRTFSAELTMIWRVSFQTDDMPREHLCRDQVRGVMLYCKPGQLGTKPENKNTGQCERWVQKHGHNWYKTKGLCRKFNANFECAQFSNLHRPIPATNNDRSLSTVMPLVCNF